MIFMHITSNKRVGHSKKQPAEIPVLKRNSRGIKTESLVLDPGLTLLDCMSLGLDLASIIKIFTIWNDLLNQIWPMMNNCLIHRLVTCASNLSRMVLNGRARVKNIMAYCRPVACEHSISHKQYLNHTYRHWSQQDDSLINKLMRHPGNRLPAI